MGLGSFPKSKVKTEQTQPLNPLQKNKFFAEIDSVVCFKGQEPESPWERFSCLLPQCPFGRNLWISFFVCWYVSRRIYLIILLLQRTCSVPGIVLNNNILSSSNRCGTKAQRSWVTYSRPHRDQCQSLALSLGGLTSGSPFLTLVYRKTAKIFSHLDLKSKGSSWIHRS